jgi:hypothetical protein
VDTVDVPTAAELNLLQQQSAASADGRIFTDLAVVRNWQFSVLSLLTDGVSPRSVVYDRGSRRWLIFGEISGQASAVWTIAGARWLGTAGTPGGSPVLTGQLLVAGTDGNGVVLLGGVPLSNSVDKLRETTDGGASWASRSVGASDTQAVKAIAWSSALGLWVAIIGGLSGDADSGVYTSPDRVTWTPRSSAVYTHLIVRNTPSPVLLATGHQHMSPGSSYLRSTDAITWTPTTAPWSEVSQCKGCWSDHYGAFFVGTATGIWSSPTGLVSSWTKVSNDVLSVSSSIVAYGRVLVRGDGRASVDGGVTWAPMVEANATDWFAGIGDPGVVLVYGPGKEAFVSLQAGL